MPQSEYEQIHYSNSGAEAIENAVKLARHYTGKPNIIVFTGSFHGRTLGAGALTTAKNFYRAGFSPAPSGIFVAPYPYCLHCPVHNVAPDKCNIQNCCNNPIDQLKMLFKQQTAPSETAAILVEPIQGEGGYVVPPQHFLREVRKVADENNVLLIADEVQSGYGRTGKFMAVEHFNVVPDILVVAKGIASGMPLSAIISSAKIMSKAGPGSLGGTYAANVLSCVSALSVLDVFEEDRILDNVNARGEQFMKGLNKLSRQYPNLIRDIRGKGLMIAFEFNPNHPDVKAIGGGIAGKLVQACVDNGVLILTTGIYDSIRLIPPLVITEEEVDIGLSRMEKAIAQLLKSRS